MRTRRIYGDRFEMPTYVHLMKLHVFNKLANRSRELMSDVDNVVFREILFTEKQYDARKYVASQDEID